MPSPITGDATQFPDSLDIPDDTDPPSALVINTPIEALADRTSYLFARSSAVAATTWLSLATQTINLIAAAWDGRGQWWACSHGTADKVGTSTDNGKTWGSVTPGSDSINLQSIAVDNSGNVVVVGPGAVLYQLTGATSTWADESPGYGAGVVDAVVRWEPVNALWCVYTNNTLSGHTIATFYTSSDRVTWTQRTIPAAVVGDGTHAVVDKVHMGVGGGRFVIGLMLNGVAFMSSAASSAPTTWSTAATLTPTLVCTQMTDPVYIAGTNTWLVGLRRTASITAVEIWASGDGGVSWSHRTTLGGTTHSNPTLQLAVLDRLVVGLTTAGAIQYSFDSGTTWYPGPTLGFSGATARSIWAGDGGFLELDTGGSSDGAQASVRLGAPNRIAVTT